MKITIVDLDWYNKASFLPNPKCMKISSYYKQQQVLVNFATNSYELKMDYDELYVVREKIDSGGIPEEINLLDNHTHLIGEGLKFYERYESDIDSVIAACRPDYQLYPLLEENKMAKADMVQFFHDGKLLPLIQDYHSSYSKKHLTYVLDKDFWRYDEDSLQKCVEKLQKDKNVCFSGGLDLNLIFQNKNKLKMLEKIKVSWDSTEVFWSLEDSNDLFDFIRKSKGTGTRTIKVPICYSGDHLQQSSFITKDFYRYLKFAIECKQRKLHIKFISPERKLSTRWFFFEYLESWTQYGFTQSLVEFMSRMACLQHNVSFIQLFTTQRFWDDRVYVLMYWFRDYSDIMNALAFRQWGDNTFNFISLHQLAMKLLPKGEK